MFTLRQISYFVEIAERGHFGRVASALGVSQPALSQQVRTLEQGLGIKLIERNSKTVQLTPVGRELLAQAKNLLLEAQQLTDLAQRASDRPVGRIRFGITPTLGPYLMPGVVAELHRTNPDLRLLVKEGLPARQMVDLAEGKLDLMVAPLPVHGEMFHVEPLFREPLHIVAPPDHVLAQQSEISEADMAGQTFLTLDERHHYHAQVQEICGRLKAEILSEYEGTSLDSLRQMAGSGVGLAMLPELYIRSESGGTEMVKRIALTGWSEYRSIVALWRGNAAYGETYSEIANLIGAHGRSQLARALP